MPIGIMADTTSKPMKSSDRRTFLKIGAGAVVGAAVGAGATYAYFNPILNNDNSQVSTLQGQLSTANSSLQSTQSQLASANSSLCGAQGQVSPLTWQLSR